jgi:type IV pilus assembly protein PilY1
MLNYDAHSFTKYYKGTDIRDYTPFTTANLTKTTGVNANTYAGLTICNTGTQDNSTLASNPPIMRMAIGNYRMWGTVEHQVCRFLNEPTDTTSKFEQKLADYYQNADKGNGGVFHEVTLPARATDGAAYSGLGPELTMRVKVCDPNWLGEEHCQPFPPSSTTNYKPYGLFQEFGYSSSGGAARAEFGVITGSYDANETAGALRKNMGDFADEINPSTGVFCHSASSGCAANLSDGTDTRATGNGAIKAIDNFLLYGRTSLNYSGTTIADLPAWGNPMGEMVVQALQYYAYNGSSPTPTNPSTTTKDTATRLPVVAWTEALSNTNTTRKGKYGNAICRPMYTLALSSSALSHDGQAATPFATLNNRTGTLADYTDAVGLAEGINGTIRSIGSITSATAQGTSCTAKTVGSLSTINGVCPEAPAMLGTYLVAGAALYGNTSKIRTFNATTTPPAPADLTKVKDALKVKTLAASLSGGSARIDILIPGSNPKKYVYLTPESVWGGNYGAALTFASISSSTTHGAFIVTWNDRLMGGDYDMDLTGYLRYDLIPNAGTASGWDIRVTTDVVASCSGAQGTHGFSIIGVTGADGNGRYLTHQHWNSGVIGNLPSSEGYLCGNANYRAASSTNQNGFSSAYTFNPTANSTGACYINNTSYCNVKSGPLPIKIQFQMVGAGDATLKDPLWYAAKYGSFSSSTKQSNGSYSEVALPTATDSWDKFKSDGTSGADGIPDGYYLARRPDLLEDQLRQALDSLAKNSNAAPAVSSSQLISEGLKYIAKFDSTTVEGNIEAYQVDDLGYFATDPTWRAGQLLQIRTSGGLGDKGESRKIITNNGNPNSAAAATTGGFAFRWSSLPAPYQTLMTTSSTNMLTATNAGLVVDYMRGDQSKENASTGLRVRSDNLLGPVVNATPWIQNPPSANYSELNFPGYRAFSTAQKSRQKLLWVSANDGMLHAFNPKPLISDGGGSEIFAYVPGSLANRLAELPLQRTGGRTRYGGANFVNDTSEHLPQGTVWPYVDGNPYTGDVCLTSGSTCSLWKTFAISTLGRGGRAIFALDVTDVSVLGAAEAANNPSTIFKWQFTSDDDADLGYVVDDISMSTVSGQASPIVKLNNGKFAIMFGNGQKSTSGKAVLFLLYVDGPDPTTASWTGRYAKIVADSGSGNGLSTPSWVDLDGNGTADVAYAGDLKGNMWKFNLTSATPSDWDIFYKSGSTNKPLFTAKDGTTALPITTAPEIIYPPFDGLIVAFGTGNSFESTDYPNTSVSQKLYGIWDRPDFAGVTPVRALPTNLTTLRARTFTRQSSGSVVITGTSTEVNWSTDDGWYINLPGSSEMILSDPVMQAGALVVTSVRPTTNTDNCSDTPSVTLYAFDPLSGLAKKVIQGTTDIAGVITINVGREIDDQKIRIVSDRTKKDMTTQCRVGDPGCFCADAACTSYEKGTACARGSADCICPTANDSSCHKPESATCTPGQSVKRVIGQGTDIGLCYTTNARTQWREVPGLRTDQ